MTHKKPLSDIRRDYGNLHLSEKNIDVSPIAQFEHWFSDIINSEKNDPTAMVLSTVDALGHPDSRVVLLKETKDGSFIFYTNYQSAKAMQIRAMPYVALNFYWPEMARQVRVRGRIKEVSADESNTYFASRPKTSQLSAHASPQSQEISSREELEERLNQLIATYQQEPVVRPQHWGGYEVIPDEFEFWQGRDNRLHDRIHYYRENDHWVHRRLAP